MTILLGLAVAVVAGVGDFLAGLGGRRDGSTDAPVAVAFVASVVASVILGVYVVAATDDAVSGTHIWWTVLAGVLMSSARPLLYRGMAIGPIVVYAPVYALVALAVPAALGFAVGQTLGRFEAAGVLVASPAVVLISSERRLPTWRELRESSTVVSACVAGILAGLSGLFLSLLDEEAGAVPAMVIAGAGVVVVPAVGRVAGMRLRLTPTTMSFGFVIGCMTSFSFVLLTVVYQRGGAAIGSALVGLSPAVTILLAWRFLRERIWPIQLAGGGLAAAAVLLLAAGGA